MINFVTLFNSRYLTRGILLYESLTNVMSDFHLYIIAFDKKAYDKLNELKLKNATIISLEEFEDDELLEAKKTRTSGEYCWTCSSKSILYVIEKYNLDECTYVDADLYFFNNPLCLIEELGKEQSVLITEHRYSKYCDQSATSGKYCVQFVTIKNTSDGMQVLNWWKDRCIEWCYNRFEDGKFGDQMYLDKFTTLFSGVHELQNKGGGVAPWNVDQFSYLKKDGNVYLVNKENHETIPLIFYHFHALQFYDKDVVRLSCPGYSIPDTAVVNIYKTYIRKTEEVCKKYGLLNDSNIWKCEEHYRDDDLDKLCHEKNYYQESLFL